jgi:hypothetical protein
MFEWLTSPAREVNESRSQYEHVRTKIADARLAIMAFLASSKENPKMHLI